MKIYIAHTDYSILDKRELFILARPFFYNNQWIDFDFEKQKWGLDSSYELVSNINEAEIVILPFSVNQYYNQKLKNKLAAINNELIKVNKRGYGYITGDFGIAYPDFSNIIYFRMGGFKSQLGPNNKGFPVMLSDHFQRLFHHDHPIPFEKGPKPVVGFCGHATVSQAKRFKELLKCLKENCRRFLENPMRKDWEPLFASAYERAKLLHIIEAEKKVKNNFIYRKKYRAGVQTAEDLEFTTKEYYQNIHESDYVICVRGGGNFSVRLYETLMMGKIPVFVNTECLLPFPEKIDWKKHMVWVEWEERGQIAQKILDFHNNISNQDFIDLQILNRKLWKDVLSVKNIFSLLE